MIFPLILFFLITLLTPAFFLETLKQFTEYDTHNHITVNPKNVKFLFYSGTDVNQFETIDFFNLKNIRRNRNFKQQLNTVFYSAGYSEMANDTITSNVLQAYLDLHNFNVLQVAWQHYSVGVDRNTSISCLRSLAPMIATEIDQLICNGLPANRIYFTGLSLGAQLLGITGLLLHNEKPAVMIGLDPSGVGFPANKPHISNNFRRKRSAQFVAMVHTDAGGIGTTFTDGDLNLFANGGHEPQPGCLPRSPDSNFHDYTCSHDRALKLWTSFLRNQENFIAVPCQSYQQFQQDRSSCGTVTHIYLNTISKLRGFFYFQTSGEEPFLLGVDGI